MNEQHNEGSHTLLAFLVGAIVGAGIGVLMAPKSGQETRRQLSDLAQKAQEKASDLAGRFRAAGTPTS